MGWRKGNREEKKKNETLKASLGSFPDIAPALAAVKLSTSSMYHQIKTSKHQRIILSSSQPLLPFVSPRLPLKPRHQLLDVPQTTSSNLNVSPQPRPQLLNLPQNLESPPFPQTQNLFPSPLILTTPLNPTQRKSPRAHHRTNQQNGTHQ